MNTNRETILQRVVRGFVLLSIYGGLVVFWLWLIWLFFGYELGRLWQILGGAAW